MKRIVALLLSLLFALSLCACNIPETNVSTTNPTEITVTTEPAGTETTVITEPTETTVTTESTGTETTVPSTDTTESTEPAWHLQETADKLTQYASEFKWNDGIVNIILTCAPDMDMFDRVEKLNETTYDIYLSDNTIYRMVLDAGSGDVQTIQDITTNTIFYGN